MLWFLYNILFTLVFLCLLPYYLLRMKRRGGYARHFRQRLAAYEPDVLAALREGGGIWVHAVSVGELFVALRFIEELRARNPGARFVLTVTTSTAHALAEKEVRAGDVLLYFPVDFPLVTRRALNAIRPRALALMECELWPNLIRHAAKRGVPIAVINARLSARSFRGYERMSLFTRRLMPRIRLFCAQSGLEKQRLTQLGAAPERIHVLGSAKYDVADKAGEGSDGARRILRAAGIGDNELVLLGGSTWEGEEDILIETFRQLRTSHPRLALVLVPRHAERRDAVLHAIRKGGFEPVLRSALRMERPRRDIATPFVLLVDTTGELRTLYACADIIFVGKSLTQRGGQNILEPAVHGKPIVVGPNMENFPVITADFLAAEAMLQVKSAEELQAAVASLLADAQKRLAYGERAARLVEQKKGALGKSADLLLSLLPSPRTGLGS